MLTRKVKIQLVIFTVLSLLGVAYVGTNYVGIGAGLFGGGTYTVQADFPTGGGIYVGADVTYNGVHVGKVTRMRLRPDGVRVSLQIEKSAPRIPANAHAVVADRSAVGEQYVDLRPTGRSGGYLTADTVIPPDRTATPLRAPELLLNVDRLVRSVDQRNLQTVIDELGQAFSGRGRDLQRLIDAGDPLLQDLQTALPQTIALLDESSTVLDSQLAERSDILSFSQSLRQLTDQLRTSDPDLRRLLDTGPDATEQLNSLLTGVRSDTGVLLANLLTTSRVAVKRLDGIEQILVEYPSVVAGGFTVVPGDGTAHFGLVLNVSDPPACTKGYEGTPRRSPQDGTDTPANTNAHCAEPRGSVIDVRGAQNAPRAGDTDPAQPPASTGSQPAQPQSAPVQPQQETGTQSPAQPAPTEQAPPTVPGLPDVPAINVPIVPGLGN
ncbi:MAG TPA: MCE family protein [Mycobacteriales bacterium]|nr:MCE family protein [Mycobacteriales bacterium]